MGDITLTSRTNGQTIDQNWFNHLRTALNQDLHPRNSSGVATDQGGSLGTSSNRWLNAYLLNQYLMSGANYSKFVRASGGSDHTITWPNALPGSTLPLQISNAGIITFAQIPAAGIEDDAITTAKILNSQVTDTKLANNAVTTASIANGAVTAAKLAALGQQVSNSSGNYTTSSTSLTTVTNLSLNLTTTGRPVFITLVADGSNTQASFIGSNGGNFANSAFFRDGTQLSVYLSSGNTNAPCGAFNHIDVPSAGTYTYTFRICVPGGGNSAAVNYVKLVVFEL